VYTIFAASILHDAMRKLGVYFGGASAWKLVKLINLQLKIAKKNLPAKE